ncbi:MAG TPA: HD domain-containing phosphohydrolase [Terriglobia bacterium]|nr:HD domain-containing phosphohydrolase [Terriglobia bacterium]
MAGEIIDNLKKILDTTLLSFLDLVQCDAGSVFTVRKNAEGEQVLTFEAMITRSISLRGVPTDLRSLQFKIDDSSLVGKTAVHRKPILLNPAGGDGQIFSSVDRILNYSTRNIFSGPLITPRGDLVGVVQLLNKLPKDGTPFSPQDTSPLPNFDEKDERLFSIIAGQSALAIENSLLLEEQERLIEGFVNACVTAIEARDPVTSGHSKRVSNYTVGLAEAVNRTDAGLLRDIVFTASQLRELRFASMLHDVGKIGVKEEILQKQKKLQPHEIEIISMRLKLMRAQLMFRQQAERKNYADAIARIDQAWKQVVEANEPSILRRATASLLKDLRSLKVPFDTGEILTAVTEEESRKLSITRGSLSESERLEIESHVTKTFEILKMIPWSKGLEQVPDIAYKHHEKLDGSGYPNRIAAEDIPPQTRMMTICDIYDALTADDRPYKSAMPVEKALDIVGAHVRAGKLDAAYFDIFVQAKIYNLASSDKSSLPEATLQSAQDPNEPADLVVSTRDLGRYYSLVL